MFQCSASNEAGYITGYTWLRVKSKFPCPAEMRSDFNPGHQKKDEKVEIVMVGVTQEVGACASLVSDSLI